jgi:hypothetical protein
VRKTATLEAALPWLYLKGISTGEMQSALEALVGLRPRGFPPARSLGSSRRGGRNTTHGANTDSMRKSGCISGVMGFTVAYGPSNNGSVPGLVKFSV